MNQEHEDQSLHTAIQKSQHCMKEARRQLEKIKNLRLKAGLNVQASTKVVDNISPADSDYSKALKMLNDMDFIAPMINDEGTDKRRKRLGKTIRNKLQI